MTLNDEVWQGHYGEAYVHALVCAAGMTAFKKNLDVDGVDFQIGFPGRAPTMRYPAIEAQVKSWSSPVGDAEVFRYPLPLKNYDDLVGKVGVDFPLRRYLFLVVVPSESSEYVLAGHTHSEFRHATYWVSLMDETPAADLTVTTSKTVYIPKRNLLSTEVLTTLVTSDRLGA